MFDLFRSRAKAVRYLLGAVLMLVAVSMVVTLVPGFVGASYSTDSNVVAEIGGEVLSTRDVQQNIQQQLQAKRFPREMASSYVPVIINQMIADRAMAYEAERLGFEVTDGDVALAVESMLPQLFQNGQFVGNEAYAQYLMRMNLTIPEFESNVRKQMLLLKIINMALEGEIITDEEIEQAFRENNEQIKVKYVAISPSDYRSQVSVTPAEISEYFEKNKSSFQSGEKRDAKILMVEQAEVAKSIEIPEKELLQVYRSEQDRFRTPERVKVRHILLKTTDKSEQEKQQIKAKAEELRQRILDGADFAEIAKENSDDTGSAVEGGDLGWIARGQTVANFEKTAFTLKPGDLSDVITTEYGYHILQVMEKEPARLRPFEEVKGEIAAERKKQFIFDRIQQLADEARAELVKAPTQADAIAQKLGITLLNVSKVGAVDPIPEAAGSADLQQAIRTLPKAGVSQVYELGEDRLGVAVITEIYPARPAELSEVSDQIRERLLSEKSEAIAQEKRQQLDKIMEGDPHDLNQIARTLGLKVVTAEPFTRGGNVSGLGGAAYMAPAFEAEKGALVGPIAAMGRTVVCQVVEKIPADMTQLASQREQIKNQLQQARVQQRRDLFQDGILTELINEGKVKINEATIKRLVSVYSE